jgi:hypothetical protein
MEKMWLVWLVCALLLSPVHCEQERTSNSNYFGFDLPDILKNSAKVAESVVENVKIGAQAAAVEAGAKLKDFSEYADKNIVPAAQTLMIVTAIRAGETVENLGVAAGKVKELVEENIDEKTLEVMKEVSKSVSVGLTAAQGWMSVQAAAGAAVPAVMSLTGTVVKGVGTLHAAGGLSATLQAIAAGSLGPSAVVAGAAGVAGYWAYKGICNVTSSPSQ